MGKNKRLKSTSSKTKSKPHKLTRPSGILKPSSKPNYAPKKPHVQPLQQAPIIPFSPLERILLIGEGDLSFTRSLISHHHCQHITATVYESQAELEEKYPHVGENLGVIEEGGGVVRYGVDATKMDPWREGKGKGGVGMMDRVFFNFPHVGGKTKDVNRQVRYNQELLVSFFKHALPSLSPHPGSSIIVTLFEGEPYTLWNIRDLGRHSGLEVKESFRFQAAAYPGYRHSRTLGVVKSKDGTVGGGWKGEERKSRSYVFVRKGEGVVQGPGKKKKLEESDDEDEDEDDEDVEMGNGEKSMGEGSEGEGEGEVGNDYSEDEKQDDEDGD